MHLLAYSSTEMHLMANSSTEMYLKGNTSIRAVTGQPSSSESLFASYQKHFFFEVCDIDLKVTHAVGMV